MRRPAARAAKPDACGAGNPAVGRGGGGARHEERAERWRWRGGAKRCRQRTAEGGGCARAKGRLTPGTESDDATVASGIAGNFTGWAGRAVPALNNGPRWQIAKGGRSTPPPWRSPKVQIVPANLGGFWRTSEGVASRVRVLPLGSKGSGAGRRAVAERAKKGTGLGGGRCR